MVIEERKLYYHIIYDASIYHVYVIKSSINDWYIILGTIYPNAVYGGSHGVEVSKENIKNLPNDFREILKKVI